MEGGGVNPYTPPRAPREGGVPTPYDELWNMLTTAGGEQEMISEREREPSSLGQVLIIVGGHWLLNASHDNNIVRKSKWIFKYLQKSIHFFDKITKGRKAKTFTSP